MSKLFTAAEKDEFIERGFVKVEAAFPHKAALELQDYLWERMEATEGIVREDPTTWKKDWVTIGSKHLDFTRFAVCETTRLRDAIDDLVGEKGWQGRPGWGSCPVNFTLGRNEAWTVPHEGWHWDCTAFGEGVNIPLPGQALLAFPHFSDVAPRSGGTLLLDGSHILSTRFFRDISADGRHRLRGAATREAFEKPHRWFAQLCGHLSFEGDRIQRFMEEGDEIEGVPMRVTEITCQAGDVFLCHPFLYHAASQNHSGRPRFMCNGRVKATQPHPLLTKTPLGVTMQKSLLLVG
jgi:hypothetical protein